MHVLLKFEINCDADAAWRALHSPTALSELYGPLLRMAPLDPLPARWTSGDEAGVHLHSGAIPLGKQLIHVTDVERTASGERVRVLRDSGIPLTGPLGSLDVWDHQMAVSAVPGNPARTLWRERLVIRGTAAPLLWPVLWATWQWRRTRIQALAPTWAYDPAGD